jgi:hypothetical protein
MAENSLSDSGKTKAPETHQARTRTDDRRERVQYIHGRIETFCQSIAVVGWVIESGDILSQYDEDVVGRLASFKPTK